MASGWFGPQFAADATSCYVFSFLPAAPSIFPFDSSLLRTLVLQDSLMNHKSTVAQAKILVASFLKSQPYNKLRRRDVGRSTRRPTPKNRSAPCDQRTAQLHYEDPHLSQGHELAIVKIFPLASTTIERQAIVLLYCVSTIILMV